MRDNNISIGTYGIIILILIGLVILSNICNDFHWNNGHCSCGGKWVYEQPIGHQYTTYYLYHCDKCGTTCEFRKRR